MGTIKTTNIETITGSGTLTLGQSGETITIPTNTTLGASGTTITIPSGCTITNNGTQTGFGGTNTPAFSARLNSAQSIPNVTETKVTCSLEIVDTDNAYDNSTNYRFTPQTAGHYLITGGFRVSSYQAGRVVSWIRKNGSQDHAVNEHYGDVSGSTQSALSTKIIEFNGTTDYVELYVFQNSGSSKNLQGDHASFFGGFKLIT